MNWFIGVVARWVTTLESLFGKPKQPEKPPVEVLKDEIKERLGKDYPKKLSSSPDPSFPWLHLDGEGKVPEAWLVEHLSHLRPDVDEAGLRTPRGSRVPDDEIRMYERQFGIPKDWPKGHVALSSIPHVGRPLPKNGVLNGPWEADDEEKAIRAKLRDKDEERSKLEREVERSLEHAQQHLKDAFAAFKKLKRLTPRP